MKLHYNKPAKDWNQALPFGNGRLGGMVFGSIAQERIQLNEDSVWYGGKKEYNNKDAQAYLPKIRQLLFDGKPDEAVYLSRMALYSTPKYYHPYLPLCDIKIFNKNTSEDVKNYRRELNLDEAIITTSYEQSGVTYNREVFSSFADNVIVVKFTASQKAAISFATCLTRRPYDGINKTVDAKTVQMVGECGKDGITFACMLRGVCEGGKMETIGDFVSFENADSVTLLFAANTSFRCENPVLECENQLAKAQKMSCDALKGNHTTEYQKYFNRVELDIKGDDKALDLPTDQALEQIKNGANDVSLIPLYFQFGRYLLLSSSMPGTLPANLQGIWNESFIPPWESKYTININLQMNYWLAESCNLAECHTALFDLIERMVENGRKTAKEIYNCRGWVAHHNTNLWAETSVEGILDSSPVWPLGGAWLSLHLWEHYAFGLDKDFLKKAYPIMKEAAEFFLDYMVEDENGNLVCGPSLSPENTYVLPNGNLGCLCMGATMDTQIVEMLFRKTMEASRVLRIDDEFCAILEQRKAKLSPNKVGKYGQLMEWSEDYEEDEPEHRHISHMFALYPGDAITEVTKKLFEAAKVSIDRRLASGGGHTGWSCAWIVNMLARLKDGEKAAKYLTHLMTNSTYPNLLDSHPPFQIDGNFGGTAGIAEMLLQSHNDTIELLPAIPKAWKEISFKGLRARGGFTVDLDFKDGVITRLNIQNDKDMPCKVISKYSF